MKEDKYYQIILMLLYNGTRISEFLDLKKKMHLEEQYFDVIDSKTENGIRKFRLLISSYLTIKTGIILVLIMRYLLAQRMAKDFLHRNYYELLTLVEQIGIDRTPHCPAYLYFHVIGSWCSGYNNSRKLWALVL